MNSKKSMSTAIGGGIILFMSFGIMNNFAVVMSSMMADLNTTMTQIGTVSTVSFIASFVCSLVAAKLIGVLTHKWSLLIGSIFSGVFAIVYGVGTSIGMMYLGAMLSAIPLAIGAHATIAGLINGWFDSKKALSVIGILFGVANFGGAAYSFICGRLMESFGWRQAMIGMGLFNLVVGVIANLLLVRNAPARQESAGREAAEANAVSAAAEERALTLRQAIRTPAFYLFYIGMALAAMLQPGFQIYASSFWQTGGISAGTAATWLSIVSIFGALVTMASGVVTNKLGGRALMVIVFIGYAIGLGCAILWSARLGTALLLLTTVFAAFSYCCNGLPSLVIPELFGSKDYTSINAVGMSAFYAGCALSSTLVGAVVQSTGSFVIAFAMLIGVSIAAMVLFLVALKLSPIRKNSADSVDAGLTAVSPEESI